MVDNEAKLIICATIGIARALKSQPRTWPISEFQKCA
jgi:hypothetical protein